MLAGVPCVHCPNPPHSLQLPTLVGTLTVGITYLCYCRLQLPRRRLVLRSPPRCSLLAVSYLPSRGLRTHAPSSMQRRLLRALTNALAVLANPGVHRASALLRLASRERLGGERRAPDGKRMKNGDVSDRLFRSHARCAAVHPAQSCETTGELMFRRCIDEARKRVIVRTPVRAHPRRA